MVTENASPDSQLSMANTSRTTRSTVCAGSAVYTLDTDIDPPSSPKPPRTVALPHVVVVEPLQPSTPLSKSSTATVEYSSSHGAGDGDGDADN
jgi:hypothetical protein